MQEDVMHSSLPKPFVGICRALRLSAAIVVMGLLAGGCSDDDDDDDNGISTTTESTLSQIVASTAQLDTFELVLDTTQLIDTLENGGPLTVFAPLNSAFSALTPGQLQALLAAPQGSLDAIARYHLVADSLSAAQISQLTTITTLEGSSISISVRDGVVYLNDSIKVISTDISATNGIVHTIDKVLIP
jgi:uncharacterized surface protein with fasciclin (FAS1) repeats